MHINGLWNWLQQDARHKQCCFLSLFILLGSTIYALPIMPLHAFLFISAALVTQYLASRWVGLSRWDWRSPLITALSLTLLLRVTEEWVCMLAAMLAIGSKFIIRWQGQHLFNPANLAIVLLISTDLAWVSPGQWGRELWLIMLVGGLGLMVSSSARRWDMPFFFLGWFAGLLLLRALWLGDPLAIPLHHLQSGALLIFAFFMISDPKTIPQSRAGRWLYAGGVAATAIYLIFECYIQDGLFYALIVWCALNPVLAWLASRLQWHHPIHVWRTGEV